MNKINDYQELVKKQNDGCNIGRLKAACQIDTPDSSDVQTARIPVADLYRAILSLQNNVGELSRQISSLTFEGSSKNEKTFQTDTLGRIIYNVTEIANALDISLNDVIDNNLNIFESGTDSKNDQTISDKEQMEYHCEDCVHYDDKHTSCLCDDCPQSKAYMCFPKDDVCENFDLG